MTEQSDAVLAYWTEHRQQLRQSEDQRSVLTNYLLVITAGLTGLIVAQKLSNATIPLALLIFLLGVYGALAVAKYHERAEYHLFQARALTRTLKDLNVLADDEHLKEERDAHDKRHPLLTRVRLHWMWTGLHIGIAVFGAVLTAVIVIR